MLGNTIPASYEDINLYNSSFSPSMVHCRDTRLQRYFRKYLLQKAFSVFKWTLPETWDQDYFLYTLYSIGYIAVLDTEQFGVIPQYATVGGYNVFYHPTYIIVSNPLLPATKKTIDIDCTIIKMQPDYCGMMDIINYYADMLALCSQSVAINLINTHTATIYPAINKAMAESYKKMFDKVAGGEPAIVIDKSLFDEQGRPLWTPFQSNVKNLYISDEILSDMLKIENRFCTEIGIPNTNTEKRERMVTDEVNSNNVDTGLRAALWLEELQKGVEKTNKMFPGLNISVDWRENPFDNGGDYNGNADRDGTV
jgi:hypothetical protein